MSPIFNLTRELRFLLNSDLIEAANSPSLFCLQNSEIIQSSKTVAELCSMRFDRISKLRWITYQRRKLRFKYWWSFLKHVLMELEEQGGNRRMIFCRYTVIQLPNKIQGHLLKVLYNLFFNFWLLLCKMIRCVRFFFPMLLPCFFLWRGDHGANLNIVL